MSQTASTQQQDLSLTVGDTYNRVFALFQDPRVKLWRGEWHEWFTYEPGEAVSAVEADEYPEVTSHKLTLDPEA